MSLFVEAENDPNVFFGALGIAAVVIVLLLAIGWIKLPDPADRAAADQAKYEAGYNAGLASGKQQGGRAAPLHKCAPTS